MRLLRGYRMKIAQRPGPSVSKPLPLWVWLVIVVPLFLAWYIIPGRDLAYAAVIRWDAEWVRWEGFFFGLLAIALASQLRWGARRRVFLTLFFFTCVSMSMAFNLAMIVGNLEIIERLPDSVIEELVKPTAPPVAMPGQIIAPSPSRMKT